MRRTTEQWEALLDGTTEGPWKFEEHYETEYPAGVEWGPMLTGLEHHVLAGEKHLFGAYNDYALIEYPGNLRLAAHAPAAVAEVIRLRKAIAEIADEERTTANDEFYPVHLRDLCRAYADDLARILEGDTDE